MLKKCLRAGPPVRLLLVYKNMASNREVSSHTGLGVSALNVAKSLQREGIPARVVGVYDGYELRDRYLREEVYTHVVLFAPWVDTPFLQGLLRRFPKTVFAVTCHSNVGFLQADRYAVRLMREQMELELANHNFRLAANSARLVAAVRHAFRRRCTLLPNLYDCVEPPVARPRYRQGELLRIGVFGAIRPQKNLLSAAWAALEIAELLRTNCEISLSSGRVEGGNSVLGAIRELLSGLPHVRLNESGWLTWPQFRSFVARQHLLLSPSYTESFCNVVADGIAEGVPAVVSNALPWAPSSWIAKADDVDHIARVGMRILRDRRAVRRGWKSLQKHNRGALGAWKNFLLGSAL